MTTALERKAGLGDWICVIQKLGTLGFVGYGWLSARACRPV